MQADKNQLNFNSSRSGEMPPFLMIVVLLLIMFGGFALMSLIIAGYGEWTGLDFQTALDSLATNNTGETRNFIRTNQLIYQFFAFLFPAVAFSIFFYKKLWIKYLHIDKIPKIKNLIGGVLVILVSFPLAQFFYWLNLNIPLPESLVTLEENTATLIKNLLVVEHPMELYFNLLVIAVIPAIGEEFIFRGIFQKKLSESIQNPHLPIWIAAAVFSLVHFQFQGFIPRLFLGGVLGYLFYWTGNLWVPILAHFLHNAVQIMGQYLLQKELVEIDLDEIPVEPNWVMTIISLIILLVLGRWMINLNAPKNAEKDVNILEHQDLPSN